MKKIFHIMFDPAKVPFVTRSTLKFTFCHFVLLCIETINAKILHSIHQIRFHFTKGIHFFLKYIHEEQKTLCCFSNKSLVIIIIIKKAKY